MIELPVLKGYIIYDKETKLFSRGGSGPKWRTKNPKIWSNIGHLKNHLRMFITRQWDAKIYIIDDVYKNSVIIDVTTGKELDFTPENYMEAACKKELKSERRKDWTIAFK